jgi:hypothetical protein
MKMPFAKGALHLTDAHSDITYQKFLTFGKYLALFDSTFQKA